MIKNFYYLIFVLLLCSNCSLAQAPAWGGGADDNITSFGFIFGYVNSNYIIVKQPNWRAPYFDKGTDKYITDSLTSISSGKLPGFSLGFLTRYSLSDHVEVRFTPTLIFGDREVVYTYTDPAENVTKEVQNTTADFPLSLKLKSDRVGNFRAYITGGLKYTLAIGNSNGNANNNTGPLEKQLTTKEGFASYEAGIGCDIYYEFFKLSPEIKISNSLGNVLVPENQPFSSPISKLFLHALTISLYFE